MPRVAFYTRISTDELTQKYSLSAQEERLEAYCKGQFGDDWTLFNVYRDTASGTTMERPELQRMVADARDRLLARTIHERDRFSPCGPRRGVRACGSESELASGRPHCGSTARHSCASAVCRL
jgi:DNA invertase Pin-like site-specific DNA recombinase